MGWAEREYVGSKWEREGRRREKRRYTNLDLGPEGGITENRRKQADKQASRQKTAAAAAERYRRSYLEELLGHQHPAHGTT